jgi:hypothetical protein
MASSISFSARTARAFALGASGVVVLPFLIVVPEGVPPVAVMLNPLMMVLAASLCGAWAAPRLGLKSALILGGALSLRQGTAWLIASFVLGVLVAMLDHALAPLWRTGGVETLREGRDVSILILGLVYGGLTEEIVFRFGLVSLLAIGFRTVLSRTSSLRLAVALAALAFALAHLPIVLLESGDVTFPVVMRTLLWNSLLGLGFGAAYLHRGLEAAILAHMGVHLGFAFSAF